MTCQHCDQRGVPDGVKVCRECTRTLKVALEEIELAHADLDTVRTKQARFSHRVGGGKGAKSKTLPLGIDMRFTPDGTGTLVEVLTSSTLVYWAGVITRTWPGTSWPGHTIPDLVSFLSGVRTAIVAQDWAPQMLREVLRVEKQLKAFLLPPPSKVYAGVCMICRIVGDHSPLYAREGDDKVQCPADDCGWVYDVDECRDSLRSQLDGFLFTAAQIADLSTYLDVLDDREKVRKRINQWHHRGVIVPSQRTEDDEPMFVFGEVVERIREADATRSTPTVKRVIGRTAYDPKADTRRPR